MPVYIVGMYPYWHDFSHIYDHRCVARGEGGAERGGFVTTPRSVEVARYGSLSARGDCQWLFLVPGTMLYKGCAVYIQFAIWESR